MNVFPAYTCMHYENAVYAEDRRGRVNTRELELQLIVDHYVSVGNQTQVPWNNNKCCLPLRNLSSLVN